MKSTLKLFSSYPATVLSTFLLLTAITPGTAQTAPATTSWTPIGETNTPRPDYSQLKYWILRVPKSEGGRLMPPSWFLRFWTCPAGPG